MPIPPFTLIGATTRIGLLTGPMRGRFGISEHIEFYDAESLHEILRANAKLLKLDAEDAALAELARRSRGTPRIANRLLRRVRDLRGGRGDGKLTLPVVEAGARARRDRRSRARRAGPAVPADDDRGVRRRPVGIDAVAATMGEERDTLEDVIEPYLLQTKRWSRARARAGARRRRRTSTWCNG
jgi:Holliday junction DNA helicase RuvB